MTIVLSVVMYLLFEFRLWSLMPGKDIQTETNLGFQGRR